jgi:hypothetical protein
MNGGICGVTKVIEENFELNQLDFDCDDANIHFHIPSGFRFLHDFGSGEEIRKNCTFAVSHLKSSMNTVLDKYSFLCRRTNSLLGSERIVGLVYHGSIWLPDLMNLFESLRKKYKKNFTHD